MKKILAIAVSGLFVLSIAVPANAGGKMQTVKGSIAFPAPFTDDSGCYAGLQRRASIMSMDNAQGVIGYDFNLDKTTLGKPFKLTPSGGVGTVDMDITFYQQFGTPQDVLTDPTAAGSPVSVGYDTRKPGGESGIVPKGMTKAIVCIYSGQQYQGGGASFTYMAGAMKGM
jgi:hypothetical protein